MARISSLQRKGQYILNKISEQHLYNISNTNLDKILSDYKIYLWHNLVCPDCLKDINDIDIIRGDCVCGFNRY